MDSESDSQRGLDNFTFGPSYNLNTQAREVRRLIQGGWKEPDRTLPADDIKKSRKLTIKHKL